MVQVVIPALSVVIPAQAGIQDSKYWIPGQARNDLEVGFRVKPGMTLEKAMILSGR
jgi:hypothetical protein